MRIHHYFFLSTALLMAGSAQAGSMTCGDAIITDDQPDGQFTSQILAQCGEPTARNGNDWLYDRADVGQGTYVLHFNDAGQLESIEQQIEDE
jgi:hypothetical protein